MSSPMMEGQLLQQLQVELAQKEVALRQQDSLCKEQADKIDALVQQMVEMENNLNHSYNQTLESLYTSMVQTREEKEYLVQQVESLETQMKAAKEEQERNQLQPVKDDDSKEIGALRQRLAEMQKRLEDSDQQMRLLQGSSQKDQEEKRHHRERTLGLQAEILKLKYLLKDKTNALVIANMRSDTKGRTATSAPFAKSSKELGTRMEELESRLGVATRLADFLQKSLQKAEEKADCYKEQKFQMFAELETIQRHLLEKSADLAMSNEMNAKNDSQIQELLKKLQEAEQSLDSNQRECEIKVQQAVELVKSGQNELLHKILQLQFRLTESRRYAEYVESRLNQLKIDKEANEARSSATTANLEFKLKEASRVSQFAQQTLEKKVDQLKQLELSALGEKKHSEFKVIEASRMAVFLQNKLRDAEKKSSADIANLHFRLTEATRMTQFLTTNAKRVAEDTRKQRDENATIQEQLKATRAELAAAKSALESKDSIVDSRDATIVDLQQQVGELESRLFVSNDLCDFLKMNLSKAEEMKSIAEMQRDNVETQLSNLTNQFSETGTKIKMVSHLSKDQVDKIDSLMEEMADTTKSFSESSSDQNSFASSNTDLNSIDAHEARDFAGKIADLEFRLTESERLFHFVRSQCQRLENEKKQQAVTYEAKIAQLEFKVTESSRLAKLAQEVLSKADQEKKSVESKGTAEEAKLMFSLAEAYRMINDNENRYAGRIKDLEFKLTESNRVSKYQEFVLERFVSEKRPRIKMSSQVQRLDPNCNDPNKLNGLTIPTEG